MFNKNQGNSKIKVIKHRQSHHPRKKISLVPIKTLKNRKSHLIPQGSFVTVKVLRLPADISIIGAEGERCAPALLINEQDE